MTVSTSPLIYQSGQVKVDLARRELRVRGVSVPIGGRAFEIIEILVRETGELVTTDQLMKRVWPGAVVEENTLQVHISAVRKALGPERGILKNIKGRGYRLLGTWHLSGGRTLIDEIGSGATAAPSPPAISNNLPAAGTDLIGRSAAVQELLDLVSAHRVITLTGPGGIGKTRLALETARHVLAQGHSEVWLVEFAFLSDPELVPPAVVGALGLRLGVPDLSAEVVARALAHRNILLLLDNCEHIIEAVAMFAETVLRLCPRATILATSREVLRIEGEHVYRVPPLDVADREKALGDIAKCSAVQLFVARTTAMNAGFVPSETTLPEVAAICQHLDGIPLAIEFAAARAGMIGVSQVAAQLGDRFGLLTAGRRTALARHQTLRAALDWSFDLLTANEQRFFRALGIFAAGFTVEAAAAVAIDAADTALEAVNRLEDLVAKSLVVADVSGPKPRFRLLDTTRAYAIEKIDASSERESLGRRHAAYYRTLFESAEAEAPARLTGEWLADYVPEIDNLRSALDWAFSPRGDGAIGVALTAAAVPFWLHLSLLEECRGRVERALAAIAAGAGRDARREMQLHAALTTSLIYTRGAVSEVGAAGAKALEIAESLDDVEYQLRSLWRLWSFHIHNAQQRVALALAQRFHALAVNRSESNDRLSGERMIGTSQLRLGDLHSARHHLERVLVHYVVPPQKRQVVRFEFDIRVAARAYLAQIMWLQGLPDQAMRTAETSVADARATDHAMSLGLALVVAACPVAVWVGDPAAAEHYVEIFLDSSTRHALAPWRDFGRCFQGMLAIQRGDFITGLRLLRDTFDEVPVTGSAARLFAFLISAASRHAGQIADRLPAIEEAIVRSELTEERWLIAELLRVKGEIILWRGAPGAAVKAESHFRQALDLARQQSALSWELRAATSLARLWREQARGKAAHGLLASVYGRFTEGFTTADLKAARALIDELS